MPWLTSFHTLWEGIDINDWLRLTVWWQQSADMVTVMAWLVLVVVVLRIAKVRPFVRGDRTMLYIYLAYATFVFSGAAEKQLVLFTQWYPAWGWQFGPLAAAKVTNALLAVGAIGIIVTSLNRALHRREVQEARAASTRLALRSDVSSLDRLIPRLPALEPEQTKQIVDELRDVVEDLKKKIADDELP